MTDFQNGNGRLTLAWVARSAVLLLIGLATWIAKDTSNTVERIEARLREVEVTIPSQYITRDETEALVEAAETRLRRQIDRELNLPPRGEYP